MSKARGSDNLRRDARLRVHPSTARWCCPRRCAWSAPASRGWQLRREGHGVTVMEQSGGDPLGAAGVHSSIYASVRLITPREIIGFSGFPFYPRNDGRRFPAHGEFLRYVRDFCDAFGLMGAVRLNTKVLRLSLAPGDGDGVMRWVVRCAKQGEDEGEVVTTEEVFDAVVVAVGQYSKPWLPTINGMDKWSRRQLHSHSYRVPDSFQDQVVVVVGFHESGKDIALELLGVASQIDCLCEDGQVVFADGSGVVADAQGEKYDYSFPFLDTAGLVTVDDNHVGPLFEHTFPPALAPLLSFVGVPKKVVVPLFYEVQARWVAQVLSGRRSLPPVEDMLRAVEEYNRARDAAGVPKRLTHDFFDLEYCDEFGEKRCGFPRLESRLEWKKELLWSTVTGMRDDMESFRDDYHDSDLVREGLRSQGWLNGRAPQQKDQSGTE
ncbi:flavin-containing monooxygenase FMO GS-OX-like 8 [Panicum miliaceum]|uniref:Flavin-containing monooxygenase n=1 Tax=Panicum miliaceum TaxID=4540 RepID=A0A3L6QTR3_PANMI|nr:flavin-containing monooxygenase FMO GS-OX-like 8 [Panicum miliaceum]